MLAESNLVPCGVRGDGDCPKHAESVVCDLRRADWHNPVKTIKLWRCHLTDSHARNCCCEMW